MRDTLKGVEADLVKAREDRDRKKAALDEAQSKVDRLEAVKAFLRGGPPLASQPEAYTPQHDRKIGADEAPKPRRGRPAKANGKDGEKRARRGTNPTTMAGEPISVEKLVEVLPVAMADHGNGGMTERQLDATLGLAGQGRYNTLRAALRRLVEGGKFIVANDGGDPSSRLYTLSAAES